MKLRNRWFQVFTIKHNSSENSYNDIKTTGKPIKPAFGLGPVEAAGTGNNTGCNDKPHDEGETNFLHVVLNASFHDL